MESVALRSRIGTWWSRGGKWQTAVTVLTLVVYFTTLLLADDRAATAAAGFAAMMAAIAPAFAATEAVDFPAFAAVTLTAIAIVAVAFAANEEAAKYHWSKKIFWLLYVAEFVVILVPMLISILC